MATNNTRQLSRPNVMITVNQLIFCTRATIKHVRDIENVL